MNSPSAQIVTRFWGSGRRWSCFLFIGMMFFGSPCVAQEDAERAAVVGDGSGAIVIQTYRPEVKPPVFYAANAKASVKVGSQHIEQTIQLAIKIIQGDPDTFSFGLNGDGEVMSVEGDKIESWAVRQRGDKRFLDLNMKRDGEKQDIDTHNPVIVIRSPKLQLPETVSLTHLTGGESVAFNSMIGIDYATEVEGTITEATGFAPLDDGERIQRFQTTTGGLIKLSLNRSGVAPAAIELRGTSLEGELSSEGNFVRFRLRCTAVVSEADAEMVILSGNAAVSGVPNDAAFRLRLSKLDGEMVYKVEFDDTGEYPIELEFVARLATDETNWRSLDFTIASGAVVPLTLNGFGQDIDFHRDQQSVVPIREQETWIGFLPATGNVQLRWKAARTTGRGELFFATSARVEAQVGAGLLRQDHQIDYQVLQGELKSISILLNGPGEILDVQGSNLVAWQVTNQDQGRRLDATLSQPIKGTGQIKVRSQTPLGAFPVRVEGLRLNPVGAIRHSGLLRLTNLGAVRLEPTGLSGLTQLSPQQFPGEPIEARQVFVYRFPAADHAFTVAADRIQPEVSVSELVLYELAEADRVIRADVELDIREAPIREWNVGIPGDYSVVSVIGGSVSDYIVASELVDGRRNLKVMFGQEVAGRQLVTLHLEKSQAAAAENWTLPRIEYPDAKATRGDIGIVGAPGFRIAVVETALLVETPLSYFPKSTPGLQQAFRIREPGWTATVRVELLERSVQSDVFHLYSLSQQTVYGSSLINYFVTGSPVSEWQITVPASLGNVMVDGQDVRTWRREDDTLIVTLHQPVMGPYTLLITYEEQPDEDTGTFAAGQVQPIGVQGERGFIQVVSPMQVEMSTLDISDEMLILDPLELPAEFQLLSAAPPLGTWQYTDRPINLDLKVDWFEPGSTVTQVVEFSEANSRVSQDGELVTDVLYYVKSRGRRTFRIKLPSDPVRLWEVSVNGQSVTARQADDATLIPLPGGTDPNIPIEVSLRLGKPSVDESNPVLTLPVVLAPVMKTQWQIAGDEKYVLVPRGGTVTPPIPVLRPSGFEWVARHGILSLLAIGILAFVGVWVVRWTSAWRALGLVALAIAAAIAVWTAWTALAEIGSPTPLELSLPILASQETIELQVKNVPLWRMDLSWLGLAACLIGLVGLVWYQAKHAALRFPMLQRSIAILLIASGVLLQGGGAPWFFALLGFLILTLLFARPASQAARDLGHFLKSWNQQRAAKRKSAVPGSERESGGAVNASLVLLALTLSLPGAALQAAVPEGFEAADSIIQEWQMTHQDSRLSASGTISLSGKPGDRFLLLKAPGVLTQFEGEGLRLSKRHVPDAGLAYIVSIPADETTPQDPNDPSASVVVRQYEASFTYQLEPFSLESVPVLTGLAAVQEIDLNYDEGGWEIVSPSAVSIETRESDSNSTRVHVLLGPEPASLSLKPQARDVTQEETQFFVEASNLYLPGPGVVDGRHRVHVRTSQGQVSELNVSVPAGLTVSGVTGPIDSWQFDAESGQLKLGVEPMQSQAFDVLVETQRGLDPLPAEIELAPLKIEGASGEVGLIAIAFGSDAQPERLSSNQMSAVNLGDFDAGLIPNEQFTLHRVYRYGADGGQLSLRVVPVEPELRVISKQVLSLGDERVVLGVNFAVEISRAGVFQLSFPLPDGLEVESLSGDALHHWSELSEDGTRQIILHLNGKTIGAQTFSLSLSGPAPSDAGDWEVPRFELNEAARQSGELVVRPTTGIRLRTVSRQNVSETDPRAIGGKAQGALAFRILQRDWELVLGIEKLNPWVTGQVLHEVTLREGQTRSAMYADFEIQNASIRSLQVALSITDEDEIKTLRASGDTVSDFVRTAPDSDIWEVQFKRRVVGRVQFQIEFERRGERPGESELLNPAGFPQARQLGYFYAIRAGGRLELDHEALPQGWQDADWNAVPQSLREAGNRNAPVFTLRAVAPSAGLVIRAVRHSLADSLELRVAKGTLTTILSPTGDQLTAVDVTVEVIQRSSLRVGFPDGGELFSIFVNGESVNSIRLEGDPKTYQFYILPGIDDRTANVRFVYSVSDGRLGKLKLSSPKLNVPLENIEWSVIAPEGFELTDDDGNLELTRQSYRQTYDRKSYLSKVSGNRQIQAQQASELLDQANQLLQAGEQTKARWALNSVANQYALDPASNEDARVQLENLQTQQAVVGLNTRRQRLFLDNDSTDSALADNQQLRDAAAINPILQRDDLNFSPQQISQLLQGNSTEDNTILQQIAARLVRHQHTTQPAPQAIIISLPEEGSVYTFSRSVQVAENAPLELDLEFESLFRPRLWRVGSVLLLLAAMAAIFAFSGVKQLDGEA